MLCNKHHSYSFHLTLLHVHYSIIFCQVWRVRSPVGSPVRSPEGRPFCKITLHVVALKRYNITAVLPDVRQDRDGVPPPPNRHVPHMSPPAVPGAVHQDLGGRHPAFCMAA